MNATHGQTKSITFASWMAMKQRCTDPNSNRFQMYAGRGIKICQRWLDSFENFIGDMGERPSKAHSIERVKNDIGYEPGNCKWATAKEQARNRRTSVFMTFQGRTMTLPEWAENSSLSYRTLRARKASGWSDEDVLTTPLLKNQYGRKTN